MSMSLRPLATSLHVAQRGFSRYASSIKELNFALNWRREKTTDELCLKLEEAFKITEIARDKFNLNNHETSLLEILIQRKYNNISFFKGHKEFTINIAQDLLDNYPKEKNAIKLEPRSPKDPMQQLCYRHYQNGTETHGSDPDFFDNSTPNTFFMTYLRISALNFAPYVAFWNSEECNKVIYESKSLERTFVLQKVIQIHTTPETYKPI